MTSRKRPRFTVGEVLAFAVLFAQAHAALAQNEHVLPLFISASHETLQGFVRIINRSEAQSPRAH